MSTVAVRQPTFALQRADQRVGFDHGWLKTFHSFSFAEYVDPSNMNWGALRVFNDDVIAGGTGFPLHPHRDMEILTYVLSGELRHEDSMGNRGVVGPGGVQFMSAGTGVRHSEYNNLANEPLHLVQMWVVPGALGTKPSYGQVDFTTEDRHNHWLTVASGVPGVEAPIALTQAATFSVAQLAPDPGHPEVVDGRELLEEARPLVYEFAPHRYGFLFVAQGTVEANGETLHAGDAVRLYDVHRLALKGRGEVVLWDVPEV